MRFSPVNEEPKEFALIRYGVIGIFSLVAMIFIVSIMAAIRDVPVLTHGTVVDKRFVSAHTELWSSTKTDDNGNKYAAPRTYHTPDTWSIQVEGVKSNGKPRAEWWEVGQALYDRVNIGDSLTRDAGTGVIRK